MKKYLLAILLCFTFLVSYYANAETRLIHSADYYSVSLDGEGDAIVKAELNIENISKNAVSELSLEFPERTTVYRALQSGYGESLEFETEHGSEHSLVTISLGKELGRDEKTRIFLLFRAPELAEEKVFGNLEFDFKSIVDRGAVLTEKIRVSLSAQDGYFVKGGLHEVDYKPDFFSESKMLSAAEMEVGDLAREYRGISHERGQIVETAGSLDALESFHVKGVYGKNILFLLANELLIVAAFCLASAIVLLSLYKKAVAGKNGSHFNAQENPDKEADHKGKKRHAKAD